MVLHMITQLKSACLKVAYIYAKKMGQAMQAAHSGI